ncbi:hypothetical protein SynA1560_01898 [Synechococcus sp. A15-60]|nr:hypothetical protein SynA1560_01898 [Synechococcus sp. A15-60]
MDLSSHSIVNTGCLVSNLFDAHLGAAGKNYWKLNYDCCIVLVEI